MFCGPSGEDTGRNSGTSCPRPGVSGSKGSHIPVSEENGSFQSFPVRRSDSAWCSFHDPDGPRSPTNLPSGVSRGSDRWTAVISPPRFYCGQGNRLSGSEAVFS